MAVGVVGGATHVKASVAAAVLGSVHLGTAGSSAKRRVVHDAPLRWRWTRQREREELKLRPAARRGPVHHWTTQPQPRTKSTGTNTTTAQPQPNHADVHDNTWTNNKDKDIHVSRTWQHIHRHNTTHTTMHRYPQIQYVQQNIICELATNSNVMQLSLGSMSYGRVLGVWSLVPLTCLCLVLTAGSTPALWTGALVLVDSLYTGPSVLAWVTGALTHIYEHKGEVKEWKISLTKMAAL